MEEPEKIVCETEAACAEFVDSGLALEVATNNLIKHADVYKRYLVLRQYTLDLIEEYNRKVKEHNQKIDDMK